MRDSYFYNLFFRDFQAVVDSGDPINHIKDAAAMHPVHLFKVLNDAVVPNSSTDRLIAAGGLKQAEDPRSERRSGPGNGALCVLHPGLRTARCSSPTREACAATIEMQRRPSSSRPRPSRRAVRSCILTDPTVLDLN